jgi:hypothetical protein
MRRKRRKVVVTVTETWTFVFDEAGELPASPLDPPALASIPTPPLDATPLTADAPDAPAVDAQEGSSAAEHGV